MMLNCSVIQGRLTADPELKKTSSNISVISFSVAVDRDYTKQGEEKQADFINVVAWRKTAEFVSKYFHKGSQIIVQGRIQTRKWQDNDGHNRYATEIVADRINFCGSKKDSESDGASPSGAPKTDNSSDSGSVSKKDDFIELDDKDDDLPF